ncbi:MAG: hypothetical protein IPG22_00015 [Acidobacteria bacterium]|nr:hypothetical protein [Acidobacteriota bacterium]
MRMGFVISKRSASFAASNGIVVPWLWGPICPSPFVADGKVFAFAELEQVTAVGLEHAADL